MRRTTLRLAGAALLAALAMAAPSSQTAGARAAATLAPTGGLTLDVTPGGGRQVEIFPGGGGPWNAGRTLGYWGKFTGSETGSYRATCIWLADKKWPHSKKQDNRLFCTILLGFEAGPPGTQDPNASGLVLQGLVKRPPVNDVLFEYGSTRQLAITGGTGDYKGAQGVADIQVLRKIVISFS